LERSIFSITNEDIQILNIFDPANMAEYLEDIKVQTEISGWKLLCADHIQDVEGFPNCEFTELGRKNRIFSSVSWKKEDFEVHVVNESEYRCVGDYEMTLTSSSLEALNAFWQEVLSPLKEKLRNEYGIDVFIFSLEKDCIISQCS
jgi:hypothetical protein